MRIWSSNGVIFLQFGVFVAWFGVGFVLSFGFGPMFVPACVRGYANRRPVNFVCILVHICCNFVLIWVDNGVSFCKFEGLLNKFGVSFVIIVGHFVVNFIITWDKVGISLNLAQCLCQHASGVMPIGARGLISCDRGSQMV